MRLEELLTIDIGSEVMSLCEAQIRGTWQIPAELVRLGLRSGASEISAERHRGGIALRWVGAPFAAEDLRSLQTALEDGRQAGERQRAIAALEASGTQALLWAAGLQGSGFRVQSTDGGNSSRFQYRQGGRPRLSTARSNGNSDQVEILWSCAGLDRVRAMDWLRSATRFAPVRPNVDGRLAPQGFPGGLYHVTLESPVPFRLGLTRVGDDPLLWLLRDGVVSARATIPGYPSFQAAVELSGVVPPVASAADLRSAVTPYLEMLIDRAVWTMTQVADRLPDLPEVDRQRLSVLLLRAARRGLREDEVARVPLVPLAAEREDNLSLEGLRDLAARRGSTLLAVDPAEELASLLIDPETTVRVSGEERSLLAELLDLRFQAPPPRRLGLLRRRLVSARAASSAFAMRLRGFVRRRPLSEQSLSPGERTFLAALRSALAPTQVDLCAGGGGVRKTSRGLLLPREHSAVMAGASAIGNDRSWIYPTLLALNLGDPPPAAVRDQWRAGILDGAPGAGA